MRILVVVSICVVLLVPSAAFAQSASDAPAAVPAATAHLLDSIPDATVATVSDGARSGRWSSWSPMRKGAVIGFAAGAAIGLVGAIVECTAEHCAPTTVLDPLAVGGLGAGIGVGIGALFGDASETRADSRYVTPVPRARAARRVSVSFRF